MLFEMLIHSTQKKVMYVIFLLHTVVGLSHTYPNPLTQTIACSVVRIVPFQALTQFLSACAQMRLDRSHILSVITSAV